jgi:glycosyltransferase involved in cell wall biosynthesis
MKQHLQPSGRSARGLKLAYDLRYATDHFPGIGVYAHGLAGALLERPGLESITFLWDPRGRNTRFDLGQIRRHPRANWFELPVPAMAMGTASATGRVLARLPVDAYLSPFWLRPEGTSVPCAVTVHDVIPLAIPAATSWARRWAFRWAMRRAAGAAAVLTVSAWSREELIRWTPIRASRIHVVPSAPAPPSATRTRPPGAPDGPFALVVAADRPHKGLDTLAGVWRTFGSSAPIALVSAGALTPRSSLADLARRHEHVHVLGPVSHAGLEWLYANATLVLVPSRYEGFGLPPLEAGARGLAVVASDIPALRETSDGVARFVAAEDVQAWVHAVRELAADPASRARMGELGKIRAQAFRFEHSAALVDALLQDLLGAPA